MTTSRSDHQGDRKHGNGPVLHIAAALITDSAGRVLVVRKAGTDRWIQPGGKIEPGEGPPQALAREIGEELGTRLAQPPEPVGIHHCAAANEAGHRIKAHVFRAVLAGSPRAGAEIAELRWIRPADAASMPLAPLLIDHVLPTLWGQTRCQTP